MTIPEYNLRLEAFQLQQLDREYDLHRLAWQINQAQATDKKGKPIYKRFKDFFDVEKLEQKITGTRPEDEVLGNKEFSSLLLKSNRKEENHGKL